jgi:hypothetical protein
MTTDNKFNGWTNYATWRVNLEMFDGFDLVEEFGNGEADFDVDSICVHTLSEALKDRVGSFIEETTPDGLGKDYAFAFLSEVNWHEIANHLVRDYNPA